MVMVKHNFFRMVQYNAFSVLVTIVVIDATRCCTNVLSFGINCKTSVKYRASI